MATFWENAAYSVNRIVRCVLCLFVNLVIFHFGFEDGFFVLTDQLLIIFFCILDPVSIFPLLTPLRIYMYLQKCSSDTVYVVHVHAFVICSKLEYNECI